MDTQNYKDSGILELYVMEALTAEEMIEVERRAALDPAIAREIREIRESLALLDRHYERTPRRELRRSVLDAIDRADAADAAARTGDAIEADRGDVAGESAPGRQATVIPLTAGASDTSSPVTGGPGAATTGSGSVDAAASSVAPANAAATGSGSVDAAASSVAPTNVAGTGAAGTGAAGTGTAGTGTPGTGASGTGAAFAGRMTAGPATTDSTGTGGAGTGASAVGTGGAIYRLPDTRRAAGRYTLAASWILVALSVGAATYFGLQWRSAAEEAELLREENRQLASANSVIASRAENAERAMTIMRSADYHAVQLNGTENAPAVHPVVYWNPNSHEVVLIAKNLPTPPPGKQYQLWAIHDGHRIDAGTFDVDGRVDTMQRLKDVDAAEAFAVTLEREGGSPVPDLTSIYAVGNL